MTARSFLILGGARSGKTRRALALAEEMPRPVYLATAEGRDDEMRDRIARHRAERGPRWRTVEEPVELAAAIARQADAGTGLLVDCLTLWLSNLMEHGRDVAAETGALCAAAAAFPGRLILVSNEVGMGLVPETPLGRAFRDAQGRLNQAVAARVDAVEFVAAGLPLRLKG